VQVKLKMEFNKTFYVNDITAQLDESLLLTRLSYRKTKTELAPAMIEKIKLVCAMAMELSRPAAAYNFVTLSEGTGNTIFVDNLEINHPLIKVKLSGGIAIVLLAVTLGNNIDDEISALFAKGEYTKAVVLDAAASCIADKTMELLKIQINISIDKEGIELGKFRISPGQLDIPLTMQKAFYDKLSLENLGIKITENLMLTPQKSVISLSGVFNDNLSC